MANPENSNRFCLNPFQTVIREGISLFTAVKNRPESLEEALKTWVSQPSIDEIIIVDWDSVQSIEHIIEKYQNGKIFLATVKQQPKWILSYACNLAARLTTRTHILKIDADVKINDGFFEKHILQPGQFFCGNWRIRRNDNEMHLNGIVYLHRGDFFNVNGYNEFIKFYGWDDSDLYQRLETAGLNRHDFDLDTLYHMPHGNRTVFQDKPAYLQHIPDEERASFATFVNRCLVNNFAGWSASRRMTDFDLSVENSHSVSCLSNPVDHNPVSPEMIYESEKIAIRERLQLLRSETSAALLEQLTREELIELYNLHFLKKTDPSSQHISAIIRKADLLYQNILNSRPELPEKNHATSDSD